ncbi:hypothetical protein Ga0466249_000258 [Sporomusaceae bacterium BoRhaA]|uniref:hypothetical protein n=1 Tax=Pelorhabdus rhamnosifermentans TaxID=2772457 RepID=UPI001C063021|nr:hypothetical protein [Pelorhabdus rhamnosifermentans]MBU2699179.1 hypothetical protein [Pelorhabdus rhamnosifermentans]
MMAKKVLFFSCEPGGAEVLIPVIQLLQNHDDYEAIVCGYGYGSQRFQREGIVHRTICSVKCGDFSLLDEVRPDCIITSACSLPERDMSEKFLWYNARMRHIPTLAFLDSWQNYSKRFSGVGLAERLAYLPDYINCINDIGQREMLAEGFSAMHLLTFGQPYLSRVAETIFLNVSNIRRTYHLPEDRPIYLFVSEAIAEYYGNSRGYTQYSVLKEFLKNIYSYSSEACILVKLHPKDNIELFGDIQKEFCKQDVRFLAEDIQSQECIAVSKMVFGMTSIMLLEAYIMGKTVVSLQPNLQGSDLCVLSKYNYIPVLYTSVTRDLTKIIPIHSKLFQYQFCKKKFLAFLRKLLDGEKS